MLAHIFTKLKICSKDMTKIINIIAFDYFTILKVIKWVWFLEPMNLMINHAWTYYKCSIIEHFSLNIYILQKSFRFSRSFSRVEVFSSVEEKRVLSKIFRKNIATSTSMDTTAKSEDKKKFKFKIRVKDTRPLYSYLGVISS